MESVRNILAENCGSGGGRVSRLICSRKDGEGAENRKGGESIQGRHNQGLECVSWRRLMREGCGQSSMVWTAFGEILAEKACPAKRGARAMA